MKYIFKYISIALLNVFLMSLNPKQKISDLILKNLKTYFIAYKETVFLKSTLNTLR